MSTRLLYFRGEGEGLQEYVTIVDTEGMTKEEHMESLQPAPGFYLRGVFDLLPDNSLVDSQLHELPLEEMLARTW